MQIQWWLSHWCIFLFFLYFRLGVLSLGTRKGYHPIFQNTGKVKILGNCLRVEFNVHLERTKLITAILIGVFFVCVCLNWLYYSVNVNFTKRFTMNDHILLFVCNGFHLLKRLWAHCKPSVSWSLADVVSSELWYGVSRGEKATVWTLTSLLGF